MARKSMDFLTRIGEAKTRAEATPEKKEISSLHSTPGFVGKVLVESNASLDRQLAEALQKAQESEATVEELRLRLAEGERAVRLDPKRIRPSAFADRHSSAFQGKEFEEFVEEIRATDGNREPGIVRPIAGDPDYDYELAAGHRRHRATQVSGTQFFSFVRDLTDEELLVSMVTENKGRKDLSAFERGRHYASLVSAGVFPSIRTLAAAINEPRMVVQRLLTFGTLPAEAIEGFADPRAIRQQWIEPLNEAYKRDPKAFAAEVKAVRTDDSLKASEAFKRLSGAGSTAGIVATKDKVLASTRMIHDRPAIILYKGAPDELMEQLKALVAKYHREHGGSDA